MHDILYKSAFPADIRPSVTTISLHRRGTHATTKVIPSHQKSHFKSLQRYVRFFKEQGEWSRNVYIYIWVLDVSPSRRFPVTTFPRQDISPPDTFPRQNDLFPVTTFPRHDDSPSSKTFPRQARRFPVKQDVSPPSSKTFPGQARRFPVKAIKDHQISPPVSVFVEHDVRAISVCSCSRYRGYLAHSGDRGGGQRRRRRRRRQTGCLQTGRQDRQAGRQAGRQDRQAGRQAGRQTD